MEVKRAGTLKVSKRTCAAMSRFVRGFRGASVRRTGCYFFEPVDGPCQLASVIPSHPLSLVTHSPNAPTPYLLALRSE